MFCDCLDILHALRRAPQNRITRPPDQWSSCTIPANEKASAPGRFKGVRSRCAAPTDEATPDWRRWLATARAIDPGLGDVDRVWDLSFREELHAIDAAVAGQGVAILSDVVVSLELAGGKLVRAHELSMPGYGFYLVHLPDHPRLPVVEAFLAWMQSAA